MKLYLSTNFSNQSTIQDFQKIAFEHMNDITDLKNYQFGENNDKENVNYNNDCYFKK